MRLKSILLALLGVALLPAQTAVYPGAVVTPNQLKIGVNGVATLLTADINQTQTSFSISACARIVANVLITIDSEIMPVTGCSGTIMVVGSRGFDATTPATHLAGATISAYVDAWHHNAMSAEVQAIENTLGPNIANINPGTLNYSQTPSYSGGTIGSRLQEIVSVADEPYAAFADGQGSIGTDQSSKFQAAINHLRGVGGGGLFIPYAPLCYVMQNVTLYSNITIYSDSMSTCIQKPAGSSIVQMFTTGNAGSGNQVANNIHIQNLTLDGNKANQTGLDPAQNGLFGIFLACSGCSIEDNTIQNFYTDGIVVGGYGNSTVTSVVNTADIAQTITAASFISSTGGNMLLFTTSASHSLAPNAVTVITGVTPSGYNVTCQDIVIALNQFGCFTGAGNPGAYVSGGTATTSTVAYVSGTNFSTFGAGGNPLTVGTTSCVWRSSFSSTIGYCDRDQGAQTGATLTGSSYGGVGDGVLIRGNTITGSGRNDISVLAGTTTIIDHNRISVSGPNSPAADIDVEPDRLGALIGGLQITNNELFGSPNGILLQPTATYQASFAPVVIGNYSHDHSVSGITASSNFDTAGTLTLDANQFYNDGLNCVVLAWENAYVSVPSIDAECPSTVSLFNSAVGGVVNVGGGYLSGGVGNDPVGSTLTNTIGGALINNATINGSTSGRIRFPFNGVVNSFGVNCVPVWAGNSPRDGVMTCNGQIYSLGGPGTSPNPGVGISDGTHLGIYQYDGNTGVVNVGGGAGVTGCIIGGAADVGAQVCTDGANVLMLNPATSGSGGSTVCWNSTSHVIYTKSSGGCP